MSEQPEQTKQNEPAVASELSGVQSTLRTLAERPVAEHPAAFESVHADLYAALAQLDEL